MGAMKVSLDFSAASIKTTKTSSAVMNISMNSPWAMDVSGANVVLTVEMPLGPPNMADTSPPAHMHARSCDGIKNAVRVHGILPPRLRPRAT